MTSALVARGIELAARTALTPLLLAARWTARDVPPDAADVPAPRRSVGLALKIALDEVFFATEVVTANIVSTADRTRIRDEMAAALTLYEEEGWLAEPAAYHRTPPAAALEEVGAARARGVRFRHLRFPSEYEPHPAEPGRARWLGHVANQTAHAWVLEHDGPPRPWLVCVPAYRMGHPLVDFTGFPAAWFHHRRGLNVVIPVLPLHGPRKSGWRSGDGFFSGDYVDTVHWQAQAVWDVRRLIAALRLRGAPAVGVYGVSLGGYTAAVIAALETELACVIAGMPATCWVGVARWNLPPFVCRLAETLGVPWTDVERLVRVVSPLALAPRVPRERRFLFAATADRLVPPHGVSALWRHWERPRLAWYDGSHVSFGVERTVRALLREALETSGLVAA